MIMRNIKKLAFTPEDSVLHVGCGIGEETKSMATEVRSAIGIDTSDEMLAFARSNYPGPNITYSFGDAQTCGDNPKWRERFDKVVSFFVLHWCLDHAKALRSILACLKPGGEGLFIVVNSTNILSEANLFLSTHAKWGDYAKGDNATDLKPSNHLWNRSIAETCELLAVSGWTNARCEIQYHLPSTELQTKLYLKTIIMTSAKIPEAEQDEYLEDLWQWSLSRYHEQSKEGHVCLPIELMVMHACKPL